MENIIQMTIGCLLGMVAGKLVSKCNCHKVILIAVSSLMGILLPLGPFGLIPVAVIAYSTGLKLYSIAPMFITGLIFNSMTPFTDPTFVWKTGYLRVLFAIIAGVLGGIVFWLLRGQEGRLHKLNKAYPANMKQFVLETISTIGPYLIIGTIAEALFKEYILYDFPGWIFNNPHFKTIPADLSHYNIMNPYFSLAVLVFYTVANFQNLAAMLAMFRIKGLLYFYGFFAVCAILLSLTAFI